MRQDKGVQRIIPISWRKLIPGIVLLVIGMVFGGIYFNDRTNVFVGMIAAIGITFGGFLIYQGIKFGEVGYTFDADGRKRRIGNENTIILFAKRNPSTKKDIPVLLKFVHMQHHPIGARLHFHRTLNKHYYELFNNTETKKLEPVLLPDKITFSPGLFKIPAAMQTYKEAIEYSPPTLMQKLAPGVILIAMGIIGLLMVMTGE